MSDTQTRAKITAEEATALGYRSMTSGYGPREDWMLAAVVADLNRAGVAFALVGVPRGIEVWRGGMRE